MICAILIIILFNLFIVPEAFAATTTDPNFKVAFIGDSGAGSNFQSVLNLIKNEGAQMVLHQGDFDYSDGPTKWMQMIDSTLGSNFPYLGSDGNHDNWDSDGYAAFFKSRLTKMGLTAPSGNLPPSYSAIYKGLKMVFSQENGDPTFIQSQLSNDTHTWKICSWHKNMATMQVGGKGDEQGWEDYETCRTNGAIIATAHEHTYHRTKTLTSTQNLVIDTTQHPLSGGVPGNQNNVLVAPGKSFVFVSGMGGASIRNQDRCLPTTYPYAGSAGCNYIWANIYTSDQGGSSPFGALFITFNYNGQGDKAHGYFKNISNQVIDEFDITAAASGPIATNPPQPTLTTAPNQPSTTPSPLPPTSTSVPNQPTSTPFLPSPTTFVPQPTTTPLPTAPITNPCMQSPTIACFLTWVNEFIGNYLTKYSDFNQDNTISLIDFEIWRRGQTVLPTATPMPNIPSPTASPTPFPGQPTATLTATPIPNQLTPTHTPTPTPTIGGPSPTNPPIGSAYRAFTADSYWNTPFPANAPIDSHNAEYIADSLNSGNTQNYLRFTAAPGTTQAFGHPIYWASSNDPIYTITPSKYGKTIQARIPAGAAPASGSDGALIIYDLSGNVVIEFWQAKYNANTNTWTASSTKRYYLDSNGLEGSVSGSNNSGNFGNRGIPSSARAVRVDEVKAGAINHRFECFWWATGTNYANHYWPMSGDEGAKGGVVPEGIVIRIKPSINLNTRGLSAPALIIAKALQDYGCMVGDNSGSGNRLGLELNEAEWRNIGLTYDALSPIPWSDWEFIQGGYRP